MSPPKTVILWVHPRSTSTMFECAILTKTEEFRVLHEPMGDAWYFGPERVSPRYSKEVCEKEYPQYKDSTFAATWHDILESPPTGPQRTFSKDMASYIFPTPPNFAPSVPSLPKKTSTNPTLVPRAELISPDIHHTFLIRTPKKAIPSYYRLCYPGSSTGFDYFNPDEAGYNELRILFDFLKDETGRTPLVLDSDDLLKEPENVMKLWCEEVGIEFDQEMLSWGEGAREHFAKWPGWHSSAENSQGIGKGLKSEHCTPRGSPKPDGSNGDKKDAEPAPQPKIVQDCIEANMPTYEYLSSFVKKP